MKRVLRLLEEQRLHSHAFLAKSSRQDSFSENQERIFAALMGPTPLEVLPMLDDMAASQALLLRDKNGMSLLHFSARLGCWEVMDRMLQINPQLCDQMTSPVGRPAHWSPLMILIDAGHARDPQTFRYMLARLLQETSLTTIEARGANGTSALHMATSKGMFNATKQILYARCVQQKQGRLGGLRPGYFHAEHAKWSRCWLRFWVKVINWVILF